MFDFNLRFKRVEIPQTFASYRVPTGSSLVQSLELERSASSTSLPVPVQYSPYVLPGFSRRAVERIWSSTCPALFSSTCVNNFVGV